MSSKEFDEFCRTAETICAKGSLDKAFLTGIWDGADADMNRAVNHLLGLPEDKVVKAGEGGGGGGGGDGGGHTRGPSHSHNHDHNHNHKKERKKTGGSSRHKGSDAGQAWGAAESNTEPSGFGSPGPAGFGGGFGDLGGGGFADRGFGDSHGHGMGPPHTAGGPMGFGSGIGAPQMSSPHMGMPGSSPMPPTHTMPPAGPPGGGWSGAQPPPAGGWGPPGGAPGDQVGQQLQQTQQELAALQAQIEQLQSGQMPPMQSMPGMSMGPPASMAPPPSMGAPTSMANGWNAGTSPAQGGGWGDQESDSDSESDWWHMPGGQGGQGAPYPGGMGGGIDQFGHAAHHGGGQFQAPPSYAHSMGPSSPQHFGAMPPPAGMAVGDGGWRM